MTTTQEAPQTFSEGSPGPGPSLAELYERAPQPLGVVNIDPNLPDWQDEKLGQIIAYNSGLPIWWKGQWLIPIRVEFEKDEHYSVILWRTIEPGAAPVPDARPGHEGQYVYQLGIPEYEPGVPGVAGENEPWLAGQDPSVWKMSLPEADGEEPVERLFLSYTEVQEVWCDPEKAGYSLEPQEGYARAIIWRTVIMSGTDPFNLERVYTSLWGHKNQFGVDKNGIMTLVVRPQASGLDGGMPEAGPGRVGLIHGITSLEALRALSYTPHKGPANDPLKDKLTIVTGFADGDPEEWGGGKAGAYNSQDDTIHMHGSHVAGRVPLPETCYVVDGHGKPLRKIRVYIGTEADVPVGSGSDPARASHVAATALPWEIRDATRYNMETPPAAQTSPKRGELMYIAFSAGDVPPDLNLQPPPALQPLAEQVQTETGMPLRAHLASYGDREMRLVWLLPRGYDSPEVYEQLRAQLELEAVLPQRALGHLSLPAVIAELAKQDFPPVQPATPPSPHGAQGTPAGAPASI